MDCQAVALRVLAHFVPGPKVLHSLAPVTDWLDSRWCGDDETFYRELPEADVIWHVLRPLPEADLHRATRARLVQKFDAATKQGIAMSNMPGANAPSVAEGTVLLMLAALRRLPVLDRATRDGRGWPSDPQLGETVRDIGACTVGMVGYGNIVKRVANIVAAMGASSWPM
jgi:phosphoglycerate dehydrogenase-like enzyme